MSADRCQGCGRIWACLGAVLVSPFWLLVCLVLAVARLGDVLAQRRMRRALRR